MIRQRIMAGMEYMGLKLDPEKNNVHGVVADVSANDSAHTILVIPTNEELVIAQDTEAIVNGEM